MTIGERIKQLRIEKGMTQLELANALFVTDRAISKWEQGRGNPDISIIPNLASTLGVSIDYLMTGNEYQPKIDRSQVEVIRYFESVVEQKIAFDHLRRALIKYTNTYSLEEIKDAIDICYERYLCVVKYGIDYA